MFTRLTVGPVTPSIAPPPPLGKFATTVIDPPPAVDPSPTVPSRPIFFCGYSGGTNISATDILGRLVLGGGGGTVFV